MMVTKKEREAIGVEVERMAERLSELGCDSVSILTTLRFDGGTDTICAFTGNYFARIGVMTQYLEHEKGNDGEEIPDGFIDTIFEDEDEDGQDEQIG